MKATSRTSVLAVLIAAVFAGNVVSLATRSGDVVGAKASARRSGSPSPTDGRPDGSDGRPGAGSKAGGSPSARSAGAAFSPPPAGTYTYRYHTTFESDAEPPKTSEGVSPYIFGDPKRSGSSYLQVVKVVSDGKAVQTRTNRWSSSGLYRVKDVTSRGDACTYASPRLAVRFPLKVGDEWSLGASRCREPEPAGYELTGREMNRVVRAEDVQVGGLRVACFVIETVATSKATTPTGTVQTQVQMTQWFAPEYRLFLSVRRVTRTEERAAKANAPAAYRTTTSTADLVSLTPS